MIEKASAARTKHTRSGPLHLMMQSSDLISIQAQSDIADNGFDGRVAEKSSSPLNARN
jgi:hypothetical protein